MPERASYADAGMIFLGLTAPFGIMSAFLPSPGTGYDKASGAIASGPEAIAILRRDEVIGTIVVLAVAAGVSLIASREMGAKAAWVFIAALVIQSTFIFEFESAVRRGLAERSPS